MKKEVTIKKLKAFKKIRTKNSIGYKIKELPPVYKVTIKFPSLEVVDTLVFNNHKEALAQYKRWRK